MIVHEWAIRALFLLLSLRIARPNPTFSSCYDFDYSDGSGPIPPSNINSSSLPCDVRGPPIQPISPPAKPPSIPFPQPVPCNNTVNGNNLYLVVNPQTKMLSIQITPPCKSTNDGQRYRRADGSVLAGQNPRTGTCSLISLITQIINSLLGIVSNAVTSILTTVSQLLQNLLTTLLGPLVSGLIGNIGGLLNATLTGVQNEYTSLVQTTGLIGGPVASPLDQLLTGVGQLLGGLLGPVNPITGNIIQVVNNTLAPVLADLQQLLEALLATPDGIVPELTNSLIATTNTTLVDLLNNVDTLVTDLLNNLLGNGTVFTVNGTLAGNGTQSPLSPLVNNITRNVETLLTDVLNDTICDVEKLLNDTGSLAAVVADIRKLVDDLLADILLNVGTLVDDALTNALGRGGLLDNLIQNIENLLTDALTDLLSAKINLVRNSTLLITNFLPNLLEGLQRDLTAVLPGSDLPTIGGAPPLPLPVGLVTQVVILVNSTLAGLVGGLDQLLTGLQNNATTSLVVSGPVTSITRALDTLLQNLIDTLLGNVETALSGQLGNITGLINLPAITSPIGTIVTGLLKSALGCNVTCNGGSSNGTDLPFNSTDPPITVLPITVPPTTQPPVTLPPITIPVTPSTNCPPSCDPSCFLSSLNQYQQAVAQSICGSLNGNSDPCGVSSLLNREPLGARADDYDYDYGDFNVLPNQLLRGLDTTVHLTNDLATNGLVKLVYTASQNANTSDSMALPIL